MVYEYDFQDQKNWDTTYEFRRFPIALGCNWLNLIEMVFP
jgi:hypothetical protein